MAVAEGQDAGLARDGGGLLGWLRRLVAGNEIAALEARVAELSREVDAAARARTELEAKVKAKEGEAPSKALEARVKELEAALSRATTSKHELEKDVEQKLAKKAEDQREAAAKLANVQTALETGEKKTRDAEAKVRELETKLKEAERRASGAQASAQTSAQTNDGASARALEAARAAVAELEKRVSELHSGMEKAKKEREALVSAQNARSAELEMRLVQALGDVGDVGDVGDGASASPGGRDRALEEREALIEELEAALCRERVAAESQS